MNNNKKDLIINTFITLISNFLIPFLTNKIMVKIIGSIDNIMDINFLILITIGFVWLLIICSEGLVCFGIHTKFIKSKKRLFPNKIYKAIGVSSIIFFLAGTILGL